MPRLFIAAWPTDDVRARIAELDRPDEPGVRLVPDAKMHVTLRFLGESNPEQVAERLAATRLPRTSARLGPRVGRLGSKLVVIPVDGVDRLAEAVRAATGDFGEPDRFAFKGHVTLARTKRNAASVLLGATIAARFDVDEIALIRSDLTEEGAIYTTLATFPTAR
jgi:RNA 2',3'-cyclic 3'-phosphodiesterase